MNTVISDTPLVTGRILIVDDDPVVAGMLSVSLKSIGHQTTQLHSGENALALLTGSTAAELPDVVILDIELGNGIDGYETCRKLREIDGLQTLPVIFLSSHDGLNDRLAAFDAGGDDFTAKPFVPEEIQRKTSLSIRHSRRSHDISREKQQSFEAALTAITTLGESGITLKLSRGALACHSVRALAKLAIDCMGEFGIQCHVQLRTPSETLTQTPNGPASPLETSVMDKTRDMGRIFSFKNRMILNYDSISLLVVNMPTQDDDLCGRIRDHAAMIAEAAELAVDNINLRVDAAERAKSLQSLAASGRSAVEELRNAYREIQVATRVELDGLIHNIEGSFIHLGLSNKQEFSISDSVRSSVENVFTLLEHTSELDSKFAFIVDGLTQAGDYTVEQDEAQPMEVEFW